MIPPKADAAIFIPDKLLQITTAFRQLSSNMRNLIENYSGPKENDPVTSLPHTACKDWNRDKAKQLFQMQIFIMNGDLLGYNHNLLGGYRTHRLAYSRISAA